MGKIRELGIVKRDEWLKPVKVEIHDRYERFRDRLSQIEGDFGSLLKFSEAYNYYGFNFEKETNDWVYREWAPKAFALYLTGDFNSWNRESHPLTKDEYGVWSIRLKKNTNGLIHGSRYKVIVHSSIGINDRIPAYAKRLTQDNDTKVFTAQFWDPKKYIWEGDKFRFSQDNTPVIYECHIGMSQEKEGVGTFKEFELNTLPRIINAGYNVIQMMAIAEHPYYGSFGYHVSNFFAVSSRFGTPEDLKDLIKAAHKAGIAVVMDIVHSHSVKNINEGLNIFDGSDDQYFHPGERGNHPSWDSKLFNYGKTEVLRFLLSNVNFWMKEFHFDGFRYDGISSVLYWHHGYDIPFDRDKYFVKGVEFDAITYLQLANHLIHKINPMALSIAEDVSGMPGLCNKISDGGIGFDYRLGMGIPDYWIKMLKEKNDEDWDLYDMFNTMIDRKWDINTIAYAESHDQALVGDKTIAFRLMGSEMYYHMRISDHSPVVDRGIALHKMIRLFTISLGGEAYLNFMGNEFGHPEWIDFPREGNNWSYFYARRQWSLVENIQLKYQYLANWDFSMLDLIKSHNIMRSDYPLFNYFDHANKTVIFERGGLVFVFNFHVSASIPDYGFVVSQPGKYQLVLNSDDAGFGGFSRNYDNDFFFTEFDEKKNTNILKVYNTNRTAMVFKKV